MTTLAEKLTKVNVDLLNFTPYAPGTDRIRGEIVVVVGAYFVHREPLSLETAHEYRGFGVQPPRREQSVRVYVLGTSKVGNGKTYTYHLLDWPYRWQRSLGSKTWVLYFPAIHKLPWVPVVEIPRDPTKKPVKAGPKVVLPHRAVREHLRQSRAAVVRKRTSRRNASIVFPKYPVRHRVSPEVINWNLFTSNRDYWTPITDVPTSVERWYRSFSGSTTPGFRGTRKGRLPVNGYALTWRKTEDSMGHDLRTYADVLPYGYSAYYNSEYYCPSSLGGDVLPAAPVHDDLAHNKALASLISRAEVGLKGNLAQDLAQFGQLIRMIGDTTSRLARSIRMVKRGRLDAAWSAISTPTTSSRGLGYRVSGEFGKRSKRSKSVLPVDLPLNPQGSVRRVDLDVGRQVSPVKSVAENWLALQYGWKPLLMDIHGALEALSNYCVREPDVVRTARGKGHTSSRTKEDLKRTSSYTVKVGERKVTTKSHSTIGIRYKVDNGLLAFAAQTGFTNPINLAWEVLPYSFVVDWFLPIGPYLETLSAFHGLVFVDGFESKLTVQYTSIVREYKGAFPSAGFPKVNWDLKGRLWRTSIIVNRYKLLSFPTAVMPTFKNPLSVTHALNGLALLRAAFR